MLKYIKTEYGTYKIGRHATLKMRRRKITTEEVVKALENQAHVVDMPPKTGQKRKRLRITGKNKVIVVVGLPNFIVTVYRFNRAYSISKKKEKANQAMRVHRNKRKKKGT